MYLKARCWRNTVSSDSSDSEPERPSKQVKSKASDSQDARESSPSSAEENTVSISPHSSTSLIRATWLTFSGPWQIVIKRANPSRNWGCILPVLYAALDSRVCRWSREAEDEWWFQGWGSTDADCCAEGWDGDVFDGGEDEDCACWWRKGCLILGSGSGHREWCVFATPLRSLGF